jgi:MFS family permease
MSRIASLKTFNLRTYLIGSSLSYIGTFTQSFAQWWLVLTISGNRSALPITIGLQAVPLLLLGTWGGTVVDRFDNRRLLVATTVLNAVAAAGLGLVVATGHASVGIVYVFSLLSGLVLVLERPALQAILSELAAPVELPSAVALNGMVQPLSRLIGPPLASLIIAVGSVSLCCFVNAASYVAFLGSLLVLRRSDMLPRRLATPRRGMVREALRYARRDPVVGPTLLAMFFIGTAGFNFPMVMPLMAKYTFHVSEARLSVPMACSAIGSLLGGVVVAGLRRPTMRMLGVGALAFGVSLVAYGAAPSYWWWVVAAFPIGVITAVYTTMVIQLLQQASQPEMLGRVMALYGIAFLGTTPIGALFVAWLASASSARAPFVVGGVIVLATGAAALALAGRRAAVDGDGRATDVAGPVGGEEGDDVGDLLGLARRGVLRDELGPAVGIAEARFGLGAQEIGEAVGHDEARVHGHDAHVVAQRSRAERLRHRHQRGVAHAAGDVARLRPQSGAADHVHDDAPLLGDEPGQQQAAQVHVAEDLQVPRVAQPLVVDGGEVATRDRTGVVHDDVDHVERLGQRDLGVGTRQVGGVHAHVNAEPASKVVGRSFQRRRRPRHEVE